MNLEWIKDTGPSDWECVYFAQAEQGGPIKIGYTAGDPLERLVGLQCGNPFKLVFRRTISGGTTEEAKLHNHFAQDRLRGEWFALSKELLEVSRGLGTEGGEDLVILATHEESFERGRENGRQLVLQELLEAYDLAGMSERVWRRHLPVNLWPVFFGHPYRVSTGQEEAA